MPRGRRWLLVLSMALLVSCVTVNIYFPAAAIQKAADQIVDDVRKTPEQQPGQTPAPKPDKSSRLERGWIVRLGPAAAEAGAGAVDLNVSTPAIRSLRDSLASRFPSLQPFYAKGAIGETNTGFVAIRDPNVLSLKERADLNRLVDQENADRQGLYAEIMRANNLEASRVGDLQRLFANSWRDKSAPGWWIQLDNGQWGKK